MNAENICLLFRNIVEKGNIFYINYGLIIMIFIYLGLDLKREKFFKLTRIKKI